MFIFHEGDNDVLPNFSENKKHKRERKIFFLRGRSSINMDEITHSRSISSKATEIGLEIKVRLMKRTVAFISGIKTKGIFLGFGKIIRSTHYT